MRTRLPLTVVNGGQNPLYPMRSVEPYIEHLKAAGQLSRPDLNVFSGPGFNHGKDLFARSRPSGRVVAEKRVEPSVATLMNWVARDNDRTMLFGAELQVALK